MSSPFCLVIHVCVYMCIYLFIIIIFFLSSILSLCSFPWHVLMSWANRLSLRIHPKEIVSPEIFLLDLMKMKIKIWSQKNLWLDLICPRKNDLELTWNLKVKTWDLLETCIYVTWSHIGKTQKRHWQEHKRAWKSKHKLKQDTKKA